MAAGEFAQARTAAITPCVTRVETQGEPLFLTRQPTLRRPYKEGLTTTIMPSQQMGRRWPTVRHTLSIAARDIPLPELMA